MANKNLNKAKNAKNDEFYTQYADIQKEVNAYLDYNPNVFRNKTILLPCDDPEWSNFTKFFAQNFENFGIKKLISTSYALDCKKLQYGLQYEFSMFEQDSPLFDKEKTIYQGKIFIIDKDTNGDNRIDINDLKWKYLEGNGDFKSEEVKRLRDEADIIVTNPPFSLFREFISWIMEANKQFLIIGNMNAISYKEVFPLIKENIIWLGVTNGAKEYKTPNGGTHKMGNTEWFTNIDHGRRHQALRLMTMADNLRHSKHKEIKGRADYIHYENYDAIEVPFVDAIPNDYDGTMGVPISFLDKYCPEQFKIIGITDRGNEYGVKTKDFTQDDSPNYGDLNRRGAILIDGQLKSTFARLLIRKIQ